jgi:hypothetical protein
VRCSTLPLRNAEFRGSEIEGDFSDVLSRIVAKHLSAVVYLGREGLKLQA